MNSSGCDFTYFENCLDVFVYILISFITFTGNVIVFICYNQHKILRSTTNIFILSLSASDIIVGIISVPYSFGVFLCNVLPTSDERGMEDLIYLVCDMLPSILSIYSLCLVAVDRAIAVLNPFFHKKNINQRTAKIAVFTMWILAISLVAFIFILEKRTFTLFIIIMSYGLPVSIMFISYIIMGYVAKQHAKVLNRLERTASRIREEYSEEISSTSNNTNSIKEDKNFLHVKFVPKENLECVELNPTRKQSRPRSYLRRVSSTSVRAFFLRRELKAAFTLSFLLFCFVSTWTPFIVLNIRHYICHYIPYNLVKYFKMLHYINSSINPLLYILLNKNWKAAFKQTISCYRSNKKGSESTLLELMSW